MCDTWKPHYDGFVKGPVGVFPGFAGSWEVWRFVDGEWSPTTPPIIAHGNTRDYDPNRQPPFLFKENTRDEVIAEAKRLAEVTVDAS